MSQFVIRTAFALLTAVGLGAASLPAQAAAGSTSSLMISTSGLDLHSAHGQAALRNRIQAAARRVCGVDDQLGRLTSAADSQCVNDAQSQALSRAAMLTALSGEPSTYASR